MTHTSAPAATGTPVSVAAGSRRSSPSHRTTSSGGARRIRVLGAVARKALVQEIEAKLRMVLSETLADPVVGGWRVHGAIRAVVRKSRDEPGVDQVVPLRNHTVKADREHELDVEVDGVQVMTLTARLDVALQVYAAVAVVRDGHPVGVRSGQAHATGGLRVACVEIAQRTLTSPLPAELTPHHPHNMSDRPAGAAPPAVSRQHSSAIAAADRHRRRPRQQSRTRSFTTCSQPVPSPGEQHPPTPEESQR